MSLFDGKPLEENETPNIRGEYDGLNVRKMRQKALINTESSGYKGCSHDYEVLECLEKRIVRKCRSCFRRQVISL